MAAPLRWHILAISTFIVEWLCSVKLTFPYYLRIYYQDGCVLFMWHLLGFSMYVLGRLCFVDGPFLALSILILFFNAFYFSFCSKRIHDILGETR